MKNQKICLSFAYPGPALCVKNCFPIFHKWKTWTLFAYLAPALCKKSNYFRIFYKWKICLSFAYLFCPWSRSHSHSRVSRETHRPSPESIFSCMRESLLSSSCAECTADWYARLGALPIFCNVSCPVFLWNEHTEG